MLKIEKTLQSVRDLLDRLDKEGAAGDVRDYLTQWIKENHEC